MLLHERAKKEKRERKAAGQGASQPAVLLLQDNAFMREISPAI